MSKKEDLDEVKEASSAFLNCVEKRFKHFEIDEIRKYQKSIEMHLEEAYDYIYDIKKKLYKIIYWITGEPNAKSLGKKVTIREESVYSYNETYKAYLYELLKASDLILEEVYDSSKRNSLSEILSMISFSYSDIYGVKHCLCAEGITQTEYLDRYVREVDSNFYIYFRDNYIIMSGPYKNIRRALKDYNSREINFCNDDENVADEIIDFGDIPLEEIREYLKNLEKRLNRTISRLENIIRKIEEKFDYILISREI